MTLLDGSDASNPTGALPGQVACGYAGGFASHIWTQEQWDNQTAEYLLPIWVAHVTDSPQDSADEFLNWLFDHDVPKDTAYMLDAEADTEVDAQWVNEFANVTAHAHYGCYPYASVSTIFKLPPRSGYIVADWTDVRHMYEHPFVAGTQYRNESGKDLDVFSSAMRFWRNPNDHR